MTLGCCGIVGENQAVKNQLQSNEIEEQLVVHGRFMHGEEQFIAILDTVVHLY